MSEEKSELWLLDEELIDKQEKRIEELEATIKRISDALVLILPMAKGYAAEHDVGNNQKMIASAETALHQIKSIRR